VGRPIGTRHPQNVSTRITVTTTATAPERGPFHISLPANCGSGHDKPRLSCGETRYLALASGARSGARSHSPVYAKRSRVSIRTPFSCSTN
jgi:hypothetical protein